MSGQLAKWAGHMSDLGQAEKKVKRDVKAKAAEEEQAILAESPSTENEESDVKSEGSASKSDSEPEDKSE